MTGLWISVLLGISAGLLLPRSASPAAGRSSGWPGPGRAGSGPHRPKTGRLRSRLVRANIVPARSDPALQDVPLLIHQLTGLLAAGRSPHQLWADAAALQLGVRGTGPNALLAARLLPVLEAAAQAASLGLSPVPVFRAAAGAGGETGGSRRTRAVRGGAPRTAIGGAGHAHLSLEGVWSELAACVSVSERSGAPLVGVLSRYAAQLEGGLDQQAARETALAGPQATVRLLTWLPAGGLGLGYLLGADPVAVLAGSPLGWLAAAAGIALFLIAGFWSRTLVRRAAGP